MARLLTCTIFALLVVLTVGHYLLSWAFPLPQGHWHARNPDGTTDLIDFTEVDGAILCLGAQAGYPWGGYYNRWRRHLSFAAECYGNRIIHYRAVTPSQWIARIDTTQQYSVILTRRTNCTEYSHYLLGAAAANELPLFPDTANRFSELYHSQLIETTISTRYGHYRIADDLRYEINGKIYNRLTTKDWSFNIEQHLVKLREESRSDVVQFISASTEVPRSVVVAAHDSINSVASYLGYQFPVLLLGRDSAEVLRVLPYRRGIDYYD